MTRVGQIILLSALLASLCIPITAAYPKAVSGKSKNNSSQGNKKDYHVTLKSDATITYGKVTLKHKGVPKGEPTVENSPGDSILMKWDSLDVAKGEMVTWSGTVKLAAGKDLKKKGWFTPKDTTATTAFMPMPGSGLRDCAGYFLTNSNAQPISYTNLEYVVMPDTIPLTMGEILDRMEMSEGENPFREFSEDWVSLPDGTVPALGETYIASPLMLEGQYLYCFSSHDFVDTTGFTHLNFEGSQYLGGDPSAADKSTWGRIKSMFRAISP